MAAGSVLAVAPARRAQPDRRHRIDATRHERSFVRGHDGISENRGDPDRDLRLYFSRRSSHFAEGLGDPDRHCRSGDHGTAAGRRKRFCRVEADDHRPGRGGGIRAVGDWISRRDHHRAGRLVRHRGVLYAGVRIVRPDAGADNLSSGARAAGAE